MSKLVTLKQVADHFQVTKKTVHNWIQKYNQDTPFEKIGHRWFVNSIDEVVQWLNKNK